MAKTTTRRPLPGLISLLALLLLAGLVWWRVLHRTTTDAAGSVCPTQSASLTTSALLPPESITLRMLNGTRHAGIATSARTRLTEFGFNIPTAAENDARAKVGKIRSTAEIRYGPKGRRAAATVRYYFPGATLVRTQYRSAIVVVSLGDGYRRIPSQATVQAAMRAAHVSLATPSPTAAASGASTGTC